MKWDVFDDIDKDDDRRIDEAEMTAGLKKLGFEVTDQEAKKIFDAIDGNDGGKVLFDEFCKYTRQAQYLHPIQLPPFPPRKHQHLIILCLLQQRTVQLKSFVADI